MAPFPFLPPPPPFRYNPPTSAAEVASGYNTYNPPYSGRVSIQPPPSSSATDFEQRVPSGLTSVHPAAVPHHRYSAHDYSRFSGGPGGTSAAAAPAGAHSYPKHKSYLSSTMISIPKSSSTYYVGAPVLQDTRQKQRHSFDSNMLPGSGYLPPKLHDSVSVT